MIPFGQSHVLTAFKKKKKKEERNYHLLCPSMAAGIKQLTLHTLFYLVSTSERIVFSFLKLWKLRRERMINYRCMHVRAQLLQSCSTLCNPVDCSQPGPSVQGVLQARILEWVAMSSSRGSSRPKDRTCMPCVSCIAGGFLPLSPWGNPQNYQVYMANKRQAQVKKLPAHLFKFFISFP